MKIRTGFVSNSSSSSFIIGVAVIEDMEKYLNYVKENNISDDDIVIMTYKDLRNTTKRPWHVEKVSGTEIVMESFAGPSISIKTDGVREDDSIFIYHFIGNEGDYEFQDPEYEGDWPDIDYDIGFDFFEEQQQKVVDMITSQAAGLSKEKSHYTWGAARNG